MRIKNRVIQTEADVDMTPMLDVVFILLIFFIVTTSFIKESAIDIRKPQASDKKNSHQDKNVLIKLTALNQVIFNNREILSSAIRSNLEMFLSRNPNALVMLRVAKTANTGRLVNIVDQVKLAGIQQVSVAQLTENER